MIGPVMMLAGAPVAEPLVLDLAARLRDAGHDNVADALEDAHRRGTRVVALSITARESILRVLEECPEGLAELRGVLLREHEWRQREGHA